MNRSFQRILCGVDFSSGSRRAVHVAARLAGDLGAVLCLFHVTEPPSYRLPGPAFTTPDVSAELSADTDRWLAEWKGDLLRLAPDLRLETARAEGMASDEILALARERAFDLIVVSAHGWTESRHSLVGSVADRVVFHASCPVLVVP